MPTWRKLLDDAADDLDVRPSKARPKRTVAEALSFHRAQDGTHAREQRTLARLTGGGGSSDGQATTVPPQLACLLGMEGVGEAAAELAGGRDPSAGVVRRPPGPPPPRSWMTPAALLRRAVRGKEPTDERRLPVELDHFTTAHLAPPWAELHPTRSRRPSRLLLSALLVLLRQLSSPTMAPAQAREAVASLPRHLRELAVWAIPNWIGRGLRPEEVDALLWDVRDWGEEDDDDGGIDHPAEPDKRNDAGDDWDVDSAGSGSSTPDGHFSGSAASGWPTLYLPSTSLSLSTLRLLLSPLIGRQKSGASASVSPVTHLSLAYACHPVERLLALPLPGHLRALSLAGVRLVPEGYERGPGVGPRVKAVLVRLARATPLLQYLDLSSTIPPLTPALLAGPDAVDWRVQWRALDVLVLRGFEQGPDEAGSDDRQRARPSERAARELKQAIGFGRGRKWLEVVVE